MNLIEKIVKTFKNESDQQSTKAKELKAAYQKEWRRKNPGKTKQYVDRYWEKKASSL